MMARERRRKKKEEEEFDANAWMITFSDLLTLLMTFFILLLTMSSMDTKALKSMFSMFMGAANVLEFANEGAIEPYRISSASNLSPREIQEILDYVMQQYLEGKLAYDLFAAEISVVRKRNSIFVTFPANVLFEAGEVSVKKDILSLLTDISSAIKDTDYNIRIEGHTDDVPVASKSYTSNWEISALRAVNIMRFFLDDGILVDRLTAFGYGEYKPIFSSKKAGKKIRNRRVEIVLEKKI